LKTDKKQRVVMFVRVTPELKNKLQSQASNQNTSLAKLVDRILAAHFGEQQNG
jgi:predicted HicB family RNase H-like nuclease